MKKQYREDSIQRNEMTIHLDQEDVLQLIQRLAAHGIGDIDLNIRVSPTEYYGGRMADISMNGHTGIIAKNTSMYVSIIEEIE